MVAYAKYGNFALPLWRSNGMAGGTQRFRFLDGLRGWAAVVVLFHHVFIDGLPANSVMADRALWSKALFTNATIAVCIFFVVSGFSLSIRYLETCDEKGLAKMAFGRYFRLAIPIFAICVLTYLLMVVGLIQPAAQRPPPLDVYLRFIPTLEGLLKFSLFNVFVSHGTAESYDPPLWTMAYEFFGSIMVFAILAAMRRAALRTWMFATVFAALALWQSLYALFFAGILLADLFRTFANWKPASLIGAVLGCCGILLSLTLTPRFGVGYIASATLLTAGAAFCAPIRRLFENPLSDFLGWISFPLYLVQAAAIYSFALWSLNAISGSGFAELTQRWIVDFATIPVAFMLAIAFGPINDLAVTVSRKIGAASVAALPRRPSPGIHPAPLL